MEYGLTWLNYELHLLQFGLVRLIEKHPWRLLPCIVVVLSVVWIVYWLIYPPLLLCAVAERAWKQKRGPARVSGA